MDPITAICNAVTAICNLSTEIIKANPQAAADQAQRWDDAMKWLQRLTPQAKP